MHLRESISYALQCRVPISNELTSNSVNLGPSISVPLILYILGESISYALQCRVPISNEFTSNHVNSGPVMRVPVILYIS